MKKILIEVWMDGRCVYINTEAESVDDAQSLINSDLKYEKTMQIEDDGGKIYTFRTEAVMYAIVSEIKSEE